MKKIKIGVILRIILYVAIIFSLIALKYTNFLNLKCFIYSRTGILCPTCGITRAVKSLVNFDIASSIKYNTFFTLVLLPIFLILFVQDIFVIVINLIKNKNYKSFVDIIFGV